MVASASTAHETVYYIYLEDSHNYAVGNGEWLVHNRCVSGAADVDPATKTLEQLASAMKELASRRAQLSIHNLSGHGGFVAWSQTGMKYRSISHHESWNYHMGQLERESIDLAPLKKALTQYSDAEYELENPKVSNGSPSGAGQTIGNNGGPPPPFSGMLPPGMPPPPGMLPGHPPFNSQSTQNHGGDLLRAAQPDEIILFVISSTAVDSSRTAEQNAQCQKDFNANMGILINYFGLLGNQRVSQAGQAGDQNVIRLLNGETPQFVADKIDLPMFKVVSVDNAKRTITLSLVESMAAPGPRQP